MCFRNLLVRVGELLILLSFMVHPGFSQNKTHSGRTEALTPEEQLHMFDLAEGFVIELVASEKDGIINPIDLTFDDKGRLWTQTARMYPLDPISDVQWQDLLALMEDEKKQAEHPAFKKVLDLYQGKTPGRDQVLILDHFYDEDKVRVSVFAEELTIPMSILPYKNGAYVMQGPELFFLDDTDQDGQADLRKRLFTGFGYTDSHTMGHTMIRGPGNWIYFSQGALNKGKVTSVISGAEVRMDYSKIGRFNLEGTKMELVNSGLNNIWGFQLRGDGQWYGTEANDLGYSVVPMEAESSFPGIGNERLRPYQPFVPVLHDFRVGGTGISGLAFAEDASGTFPSEFANVAFLANPITSSINAVRIVRNSDGSVSAEHLEDLVTSEDDWFRPVNMEFGPDGCLYIADWYNKIVSHNELPTTHPDRDKKHGRIWRVRHVSQKPSHVPDFYSMSTPDLVQYLSSPSVWAKRAAWNQIMERPIEETVELGNSILQIVGNPDADEITRIHALWCLESLGVFDEEWMSTVLRSESESLIREGIRSLASFDLDTETIVDLAGPLVFHPNPQIRAQVLRTLGEIQSASPQSIGLLVKACRPELPGNEMGGSYERRFERYLARKALENYPDELKQYLEQTTFSEITPGNMLWASQALPDHDRKKFFLRYWPEIKNDPLGESDFAALMTMVTDPDVFQAMEKHMTIAEPAEDYIRFSLSHLNQIRSEAVGKLLLHPVRSLIRADEKEKIELGLNAIHQFNIEGLENDLLGLDKTQLSEQSLGNLIKILGSDARSHLPFMEQILGDDLLKFSTRLSALSHILRVDQMKGFIGIDRYFPGIEEEERKKMIQFLSTDASGVEAILKLYKSGYFNKTLFDASSVDRIVEISNSNLESLELKRHFEQKTEGGPVDIADKLKKYTQIAREVKGDVFRGEKLFASCLLCHRVGDAGQDLAPALDGSKYRTDEALLTAILDPDAAVESGYSVYRVVKTGGSIVEGYLVEKNEAGTTLAFVGGSTSFIPKEEIQSESFLAGRSFMLKGLIDEYSDQQVADLIAYIRSIN